MISHVFENFLFFRNDIFYNPSFLIVQMDYYCEVCLKNIKAKSKYKYFKSKSHQEIVICKHIIISRKDIDINNVVEAFYLYIIEHNKKLDYYLINCEFEIVFKDCEYSPYVTSKLSDNKTMISWKNFLMKVIDDFVEKDYNFSHKAEKHIITIAHKMDMSYDFYIKHNMCAPEWKLNDMINKNKCLINKFARNWKHLLNRKFES